MLNDRFDYNARPIPHEELFQAPAKFEDGRFSGATVILLAASILFFAALVLRHVFLAP